jgi:small GTP-binding protein
MYDATFKIVIFGDAGTGKELLTQRFLTNLFVSDSKMTIGVDFEVKSLVVDGKNVKLQIWDFEVEERFRFLLPTYVRGARGGMFFYDITNYSSIAHIDDWLTVIRKEIIAEDEFPIIVVGGNADLSEYREVSVEEGIKIARSRGVDGFIEVSAQTGVNVERAFEALTRLMLYGAYEPKEEEKAVEVIKKEYPIAIEEILLFMYNRQGRYKGQTTHTYLEGKITKYPEEAVKKGFDWLKSNKKYADEISKCSIKINKDGINLLKNLNRIPDSKP